MPAAVPREDTHWRETLRVFTVPKEIRSSTGAEQTLGNSRTKGATDWNKEEKEKK